MFTSLFFVLVAGWGIGWFVARSLVASPIRLVAAELAAATKDRGEFRSFELTVLTVVYWVSSFLAGVTHCAACTGFWAGCALALWGSHLGLHSPLSVVGTGLAVMGANALLDGVLAACLTIADGDQTHG